MINQMNFYRSYRYEIIAALCGAVVMILELVGARMSAPFFGTSIYVWTAMIGVILGALSVGYWYGGVMADRKADDDGLMRIIFFAACTVLLTVMVQGWLLPKVADLPVDLRLQALLGAFLLFAPPALLLGIVSPYVAKLRLSSISTVGQSIGRLYAAGTLGSIVGTFLAGYWLVAWFGNHTLGLALVAVLVLVSFSATTSGWVKRRVLLAVAAVVLMLIPSSLPPGVVADVDSAYSRYQVAERQGGDMTMRLLTTDRFSIQSAQIVGMPLVLPLEYTMSFDKALDNSDAKRVLVIGGGTYTFPSVAAAKDPKRRVTAVEIDPTLNDIARKYFAYEDRPNLEIINQDGRTYLNGLSENSFDIVFLDAFSSLTPPYQLTTFEAAQLVSRALSQRGVAVANVVGSPEDDSFTSAMYSTYRKVFRHVAAYPVFPGSDPNMRQNILFIMTDDAAAADCYRTVFDAPLPIASDGMILTDDFAPVEQLIGS